MTTRRREFPSPIGFGAQVNCEIKAGNRDRRDSLRRLSAAQAAGAGSKRNDLLPPLEFVEIRLDELKLSPRRLRKQDPAHVREVANAITTLGFSIPVLVGKGNVIINGEVAVAAARLVGLDRVPCICIGHLTASEQRVLRLAVNRLVEKGQWDLQALKLEFNELILDDAPIEIAGFAPDEIDTIISLDPADGVERGPLAPESGAVAIARRGDLYQLGPHNVLCGDAADPNVLRRLMAAQASRGSSPRAALQARKRPLARIVLTDEPYNVPIAGNVTNSPHREFVMASGELRPDEYLAFNEAWMTAVLPHLVNGGLLATFIDWRGYATVDAAALSLGLVALNLVVWAKSNAGQGSLFRSQHELLPLYRKGDAPHVNNIALGRRGRWRSNVWTYPGASSLGSEARRGLADHPTVKPTAMLADALIDLTHRGDTVIDPFLGSGSTLIAAHRTGRICRGVELDPLYVDLIIRRFEAETGEKAILAETGETHGALATRRAEGAELPARSPEPAASPGKRRRRGAAS